VHRSGNTNYSLLLEREMQYVSLVVPQVVNTVCLAIVEIFLFTIIIEQVSMIVQHWWQLLRRTFELLTHLTLVRNLTIAWHGPHIELIIGTWLIMRIVTGSCWM
jgi:uncharacterized membrane protein